MGILEKETGVRFFFLFFFFDQVISRDDYNQLLEGVDNFEDLHKTRCTFVVKPIAAGSYGRCRTSWRIATKKRPQIV